MWCLKVPFFLEACQLSMGKSAPLQATILWATCLSKKLLRLHAQLNGHFLLQLMIIFFNFKIYDKKEAWILKLFCDSFTFYSKNCLCKFVIC